MGKLIDRVGIDAVLAPRPVAFLALDAVLDVERRVLLPLLGVRPGGVAPQAHRRLLRLLRDAAQLGDLLGLRLGEDRVRPGVLRGEPEAELVPHPLAPVARRIPEEIPTARAILRPVTKEPVKKTVAKKAKPAVSVEKPTVTQERVVVEKPTIEEQL